MHYTAWFCAEIAEFSRCEDHVSDAQRHRDDKTCGDKT